VTAAPTTLREWLAPATVAEFTRDQLGRVPVTRSGAACGATGALTWQTLDRVLALSERPDVTVTCRGRALDLPPPRSLEEARGMMAQGLGFVVGGAERHDAELGALGRELTRELPGEAEIKIFVTPADTHGLGWHYDFEEVFIVQTAGVKDYYFRQNTVDRATPAGAQPDFNACRHETTPLATVRLAAGDWLYLPARWWHVAKCVEDSLSVSLRLRPRSAVAAEGRAVAKP
jgi:50S ribosomal protein L16 3-hydroxylase